MANSIDLEPRFTRGEYWLLETVVCAGIPLCWLAGGNLEEVLNKQSHGLDRKHLKVALNNLFTLGLIVAHRSNEEGIRYTPTMEQIEAILDEPQFPDCTYYSLTSHGGAQWEAFAAPNWNRYIDAFYSIPEDQEAERGELVCADKELAERYLQGIHHSGIHIDPTTVTWEQLKPWQATYWKELPLGYRARFTCRSGDMLGWDSMPLSYYWIYKNRWYQWG